MKELWLSSEFELQKMYTLYVIGNGFDIAHGIDSKYSDFKKWLLDNKEDRLIELMDVFFSNKRNIWGDIEKALGEYDENSIIEFCRIDSEIDYDHPTRSIAAIEDSPDFLFKPILEDFKTAFDDWVNSIGLSGINRIKNLPKDCKYLTFNYTETLEKVYGISRSEVLHIHGSRLLKDEYIVGHNNTRNENEPYNDESQLDFMQDTQSKIIQWMNQLRKDTKAIITNNQEFFRNLTNIQQVVVYGHSFYKVDWPYFFEIANSVNQNATWKISYYAKEDVTRIDSFLATSKITARKFQF